MAPSNSALAIVVGAELQLTSICDFEELSDGRAEKFGSVGFGGDASGVAVLQGALLGPPAYITWCLLKMQNLISSNSLGWSLINF